MRKTILLTILAITLTNCGGSGSSQKDGIHLDFHKKGVAAYDLKEYSFDLEQRDINMTQITYTNQTGQRFYDNLPSSKITRVNHTYTTKIDGSIIKVYEDSKLDSTSIIHEDKIVEISDDINITTVRYVDIRDYVTNWSKTDKENDSTIKGESVCKIENHQDSMRVGGIEFEDILQIKCNLTIKSDGKTDSGKPLNLSAYSDYVVYIAKGVGEIKSIDDGCEVVKISGKIKSNECEKVVKEIASVE